MKRLGITVVWLLLAVTGCAERTESPLVTVDLFTDLACAHCARAEHVMDRIAETWPDDVQIRHRHLPLPFHPRARPAAIAVEAASEQGAGARMRRRLFATASRWPDPSAFDPFLREMASQEGLDVDRFAHDLTDAATATRVDRDSQVAGLLDVNATPTVFVNGRRIRGRIDYASVVRTLRAELTAARSAVMQGDVASEVAASRTRTHMGDPRRAAWLMGLQAPPMNLPGTGSRPRARSLRPQPNRIPDDARWAVPVDPTSPRRGAEANVLVTLVLFEDLSSPFSKRLHPTLNALLSTEGEGLSLSYRHLPLPHNPAAKQLAHAAHCAHEQGQFWAMRDQLLTQDVPSADTVVRSLGLDAALFSECLGSPRPTQRVSADAQIARRVAVGGTPVLFVNGRKSAGARSLDELRALVERERVDARARAAAQESARTKRQIYDVITQHGRARVPLAPSPTTVSDVPTATLGAESSALTIQAWLDLSDERQRRSLKALAQATRTRGDLRIALFPAEATDDEHARAWRRAFWCAKEQGKVWRLLDAAAAATRHTHHNPAVPVSEEGHDDGHDALDEVLDTAEVDLDACRGDAIPRAMFSGPTWLVNGHRYDGSMGWGPAAVKRVLTFAAGAP